MVPWNSAFNLSISRDHVFIFLWFIKTSAKEFWQLYRLYKSFIHLFICCISLNAVLRAQLKNHNQISSKCNHYKKLSDFYHGRSSLQGQIFFLSLNWICYNIASVLCFGFLALTPSHVGSYFRDQGLNLHALHWKAKS